MHQMRDGFNALVVQGELPDTVGQYWRQVVVEEEFHAAMRSYRNAASTAETGISNMVDTFFLSCSTR